jgi:hypothetical protein
VRRIGRLIIAVVAALLLAWLAFAVRVVIFPTHDHPEPADAIVVIGPVDDWREDLAYELVDQGIADTVTFTSFRASEPDDFCTPRSPDVRVECILPDPYTTQGEATWVRDAARERGWERVVVITMDAHIERARFIFQNCVDGVEVLFPAEPEPDYSFERLAHQFAYQTGAWAKAVFVTPGCAE